MPKGRHSVVAVLGGDEKDRKKERKPNAEVVIEVHCDVLVVILALNRRKRAL